jgi:hypothetical protein
VSRNKQVQVLRAKKSETEKNSGKKTSNRFSRMASKGGENLD